MTSQKVGRYEVLGQLATGGMGEILLARLSGPASFARAVVIKRVLRQYARSGPFVTMFLDEARTIAKIRHPNVVQVHELGEEDGEVFLVLEYVAGENLSSVLKRSVALGERLDPLLVAHILAEACAGLHAAHELVSDDGRHQNLVHRDVSPQNLFVAYDGHVKLLDFGVALTEERVARTEAGDVKGKLEYMSPEQVSAESLDRRSDIFAMGIVLYELATGRRLFKRKTPARTAEAIITEPVIPPTRVADGFPPELEAIILKALAKRPDERFATAAEMRGALLEVTRAVKQPVEAIAERMHRWFPERIAEKNEMLRRVSNGDSLSGVPASEVDETVRIPNMPEAPPSAKPRPSAPPSITVTFNAGATAAASDPVRKRRRTMIVSAAVLSLLFSALLLTRRMRDAAAVVEEPALSTTPVASSPAVASSSPSVATPAPSSSQVTVHVESKPAGAHVTIGGSNRGLTPLDIHMPRGSAQVAIELHRAGFVTTTQTIVPDADQKLLLALQPAPMRQRPTPAATSTPTPPAPTKLQPSTATPQFGRFD